MRIIGDSATLDDIAFCPTLKALFENGVVTGRTGRKRVLSAGLSTLNNLRSIRRVFESLKPVRTLELGLGGGASALLFAALHQSLGREAAQQHIAIDPFQDAHFDGVGYLNLEQAGLDGYVKVFPEPSQYRLPRLLEENQRFGLMYFDGSKRSDDLYCDFYYAKRLLDMGGVILFDDCAAPGTRALIRYIDHEERSYFRRLPRSEYRNVGLLGEAVFRAAEKLRKVQLIAVRKIANYTALETPVPAY
jgi:predicted O-methyltransferase YrrM